MERAASARWLLARRTVFAVGCDDDPGVRSDGDVPGGGGSARNIQSPATALFVVHPQEEPIRLHITGGNGSLRLM